MYLKTFTGKLIAEVRDDFMDSHTMGIMLDPDGYAWVTGVCGDTMEIYIRLDGRTIVKACFMTDGCRTSVAAAGMATRLAEGATLAEADGISQRMILDALGGLPEGSEHCALLASRTLRKAIESVYAK